MDLTTNGHSLEKCLKSQIRGALIPKFSMILSMREQSLMKKEGPEKKKGLPKKDLPWNNFYLYVLS